MLLFAFIGEIKATHNRSGEITYCLVSGLTYKIRVYTYTNPLSTAADRCDQTVYIDGGLDSVKCPRVNGFVGSCSPYTNGVVIVPAGAGYDGTQENIYEAVFTFSGPGNHTLTMYDPNRNQGVNNIPNSVNEPFALNASISIGNFPPLLSNCSPTLLNPPVDNACVGQPFIHNPGASDPDGDSISYSLTNCLGTNGNPIVGYFIPPNVSINPATGDLLWNTPTNQGEYNFAILITEWRKDLDGNWQIMGTILRDLQVLVAPCPGQNKPNIDPIPDTCIVAGTSLIIPVTANDPDGNLVTLTATGLPLSLSPAATFTSNPGVGTATGTFNWTPNCSQSRISPYQITVKAQDNGSPINLVDFKSFFIKVVPPPPSGLTVNPSGTSMLLNWLSPNCPQTTGNVLLNYFIYRKNSCDPFIPDPCGNADPISQGYSLIGQVNNSTFNFTDNNGGLGLSQGINYAYVVAAVFADGSKSYTSNSVCAKLNQDLPLILNVSVDTTDALVGQMYLRWKKPFLGTGALDTVLNPGPYEFRLLQASGTNGGTYTQIQSVTNAFFANLNQISDTTFTSTLLNTAANPYNYKIEFYSNSLLKGVTQSASSVFLTAASGARKVNLSWTYQVPWNNDSFFVYRQLPPQTTYTLVGTSVVNAFTDTGLVNGVNYCYRVLAKGKYSDPAIFAPLYNWSQKACAIPIDTEAPCSPSISASGDCETNITSIIWNNPNNSCADDVVMYYLYYTKDSNDPMVLLDSITNPNDTIFVTDYATSIAGCYAIAAVDSFGNTSPLSEMSCVDNCPEYELPNIITANSDNLNDILIPVKNKFIESIKLHVYNRWGSLLFTTNDPKINWDCTDPLTKQRVSDGVYFYTCEVNEIHFDGIETRKLKGFIHILTK